MELAPNYYYTLSLEVGKGVHVGLYHKTNGMSKTFFLAAHRGLQHIASHMETLTDSQCDQFVGVKEHKGKDKKTKG